MHKLIKLLRLIEVEITLLVSDHYGTLSVYMSTSYHVWFDS